MAKNILNPEEIIFVLNGRAYTRQEAEEVFTEERVAPQKPRRARRRGNRMAAAAAKKAAEMAAILSIRLGCSFNAAFAAAAKSDSYNGAAILLTEWADKAWNAPRRTADEVRAAHTALMSGTGTTNAAEAALSEEIILAQAAAARMAAKKAAILIGTGTTNAAEEALKQERRLAEAASAAEARRRHYEAIMSRNVVAPRKEVKLRSDRSARKAAREERALAAWASYHAACAAADAGKCQRVWASAHNLPVYWEKEEDEAAKAESFKFDLQLFAAEPRKDNILELALFVLGCTANEVEQLRANGKLLEVVSREAEWLGDYLYEDNSGKLEQRYNAACELHELLISGGNRDNGGCSHESATTESVLDVISGMFNPEINRIGIRGVDWVDDSRLIEADDIMHISEGGNAMFKFDLQLFANGASGYSKKRNFHIASKRYVRSMKGHEGNAMAYNVKAVPTDNRGNYRFIINREYAEVTPLTRDCLHEGPMEMADLTGRKIVVKRAFDKYATLDTSAMICSTNKQVRRIGAAIPMLDVIIGEYQGEVVACSHMKGDDFMVIMSEARDKNGKHRIIQYSEAVDVMTGKTKEGWMNFSSYKIFGASKGRKNLFDMFEHDSDFEEKLDIATCGEWGKVHGTVLNQKEVADAVTRLGSKSCRLGSEDIIIDNVVILLEKNDYGDGSGCVANLPGVRPGYLLQCRPYTAKGAAQSVSSLEMEVAEENHRIVEWDKHNLTERQEYLLDAILNKHDMAVSGLALDKIKTEIDAGAIRLVGDPKKKTQLMGDLNFFKDKWDYSRNSGLNIIDIACFTGDDFKDAYTSGQMLKVILRAMHDSNDVQLKQDFDVFMRQIIASEVKAKMSLDSERRFHGTEKFNLNYIFGAFMQLNASSWKQDPEVFNLVIKEKIKAIRDTMNRDRYGIYGHSTMVTVESTHFLADGRHSLLNTEIVDGVVKSFEVFDPVWCRYAEKNPGVSNDGFVIKYPSMGTKEGILIKFVTEKEMLKRINKLGVVNRVKDALRLSITNFKEGATMVPHSLPVLALILAGFDLDGDHFEVLFATESGLDIPTLLKRADFIGAAVHIKQDEAGYMASMEFTPSSWSLYSRMIVNSENKSVGTVTNVFRLFTDGLLRDLSEPNVHEFYKNLFMAVGCANGEKKYKTVGIEYDRDKDFGKIFTYQVAVKAMEMFIENIKDVNLDDVDNIHAMLDDLDKLGRACQELTIDAQKKFYDVFCDWMDKVTNFSLFVLSYGLEFKITGKRDKDGNVQFDVLPVENDGYGIKNGFFYAKSVLVTKSSKYGTTRYILADSFVPYRMYCANYACRMVKFLLHHYNEACVEHKAMMSAEGDARLAMLNNILNEKAMLQIERISRGIFTINKMRAGATERMEKLFSNVELSAKMREKLSRDINAGVNADYGVMLDAISNEIRRICADNSMDPMIVAEALTLRGNIKGVSGKVLQYERFINMINNSDTPVFTDVLRAPHYFKEYVRCYNIKELDVVDGVFSVGEVCVEDARDVLVLNNDVCTDLVDGKYTVSVDSEGELLVSRPMTEFVDANVVVDEDSRVIVDGIKAKDASELEALDAALVAGKEYKINVDTRNYAYSLSDEDGSVVTKLYFGNRDKKVCGSYESNIMSKGYKDFTGKLAAKIIGKTGSDYVDKNGCRFYNTIIVLKK